MVSVYITMLPLTSVLGGSRSKAAPKAHIGLWAGHAAKAGGVVSLLGQAAKCGSSSETATYTGLL